MQRYASSCQPILTEGGGGGAEGAAAAEEEEEGGACFDDDEAGLAVRNYVTHQLCALLGPRRVAAFCAAFLAPNRTDGLATSTSTSTAR